jgi:hypothetical protein
MSGEVLEHSKPSASQHRRSLTLLELTAAFLKQVSADRTADPLLRTLDFRDQEELVPE